MKCEMMVHMTFHRNYVIGQKTRELHVTIFTSAIDKAGEQYY